MEDPFKEGMGSAVPNAFHQEGHKTQPPTDTAIINNSNWPAPMTTYLESETSIVLLHSIVFLAYPQNTKHAHIHQQEIKRRVASFNRNNTQMSGHKKQPNSTLHCHS